ncbi:L-asparaginase/Glu-tRNA(Gln) amidotransferase subunit D [Bacillus fengqiuensis]|nr:L-asparaginase/Glu-tRNA(Gln) amidotransferase subunit D [Bacillus fengqiuensis]
MLCFYQSAVLSGVKGIVVAGSGNGSISSNAMEDVKYAVGKGVVVTRSSRVGSGIVTHGAVDDQNGLVSSDSLNPQKSHILLMLALTQTKDPKIIQEFFNEY